MALCRSTCRERAFLASERQAEEEAAEYELAVQKQELLWEEESSESSEGEMNADLDFTPSFGKAGMHNHLW